MKLIGSKLTKKIVLATAFSFLCLEPLASAQIENINASGSYTIGDGDENINVARQKAKDDAMRMAVEKAGVYVESYSKVENMTLTADEVRTIAGNILKINSCEIEPIILEDEKTKAKTIKYICYINAIIDTDVINLKMRMEQRRTSEKIESLENQLSEAMKEIKSLTVKLKEAQQQPYDKMILENQLVRLGKTIEAEMKKDVVQTGYLQYVSDSITDMRSISDAYVGSSFMQADVSLHKKGLSFHSNNINNTERNYSRIISSNSNIKEDISLTGKNGMVDAISAKYSTSTTSIADSLYQAIYISLFNKLGVPVEGDISEEHVGWKVDGIEISVSKYGKWVSVRKGKPFDMSNRNHSMISNSILTEYINGLDGEWYNTKGQLVLSVQNGYINGCQVVAGYDFVGKGINGYFRIKEANGYRELKLYQIGTFGKYMILNDKIGLRRNPKPDCAESILGICLGLGKEEASNILGRPERSYVSYGHEVWSYDGKGIKLYFKGDIIEEIGLINNGQWHFDHSGLNYMDTIESYKEFYGRDKFLGDHIDIGKREYLWFTNYPKEIKMSLWSN